MAVIFAAVTTSTLAIAAPLMRSRIADRRGKQASMLIDHAETPGLESRVKDELLAQARDMIAWDAARRKYPDRRGFMSAMATLGVNAAIYLVISWPGFQPNSVLHGLSWFAWAAMMWAISRVVRKLCFLEADFARQKLSQITAGADIEAIEPLYPARAYILDRLKPRRRRNPELRLSPVAVLLRDAWELNTRSNTVSNAEFTEIVGGFVPRLESDDDWEVVGKVVGVTNINAAIRSRNGAASR
ncbi:hypothetical protein [Antrihabitans spumae]|uniref:Uncharacterized protein n=2 Tax=Antrihabitans spumae TaxID=3373370 RepID=A0ABW7KJX7_9NOCA